MKILVAPDSFKGSLDASRVAEAIARGIRFTRTDADIEIIPLADGGEGTIDAFLFANPSSQRRTLTVTGPDGCVHETSWLWMPHNGAVGVVELASTSGIEMLSAELRPWDADTAGFGEAVAAALDAGVDRLLLAIGSSASTDGGMGFLSALGVRFLDRSGETVSSGARGLGAVARIDASRMLPPPPGGAAVLTDVTAPLTGRAGATHIFGPQKGLTRRDIEVVDRNMARYARLLSEALGTAHEPDLPGAGAAGGVGFALHCWGARLEPGAKAVAELTGLHEAVAQSQLIVTGEGRFDAQSTTGKVPGLVIALAEAAGVSVVVIAGDISPDAQVESLSHAISLTELAGSTEVAIENAEYWLAEAGRLLNEDRYGEI